MGRIKVEVEELVGRATSGKEEEKVLVSVRPKTGGGKVGVCWTDSGVSETLLAERDWQRIREKCPSLKLRKNMIKFRPYMGLQ